MTVSSIVPVNTYTGNSTVKKFDFDFLIESENELIVQHISEDNVITTLTLGVDYSINEIGNQNGSYIIFPLENSSYNILKENEKITLMLTLTIKQESEFKNSSYFNLNILEWTFDYIVRILQILSRKIERCVKVGEGLSSSPDELMDELNESKRIAISAAESALESQNIAEENKNDCIEYLEEYNQKVLDFNKEYNECLQSIIDKGIDTRCDLDLSNLSETGEKHFINKTQISNCVLEVPQDIKLELNGEFLKVKSGTKLYDASNNLLILDIERSTTITYTSAVACYVLIKKTDLGIFLISLTDPKLKFNNNKVTYNDIECWLPLGIVTRNISGKSTIDKIFNGIGYIKNNNYLLPNVKMLIAHGYNQDGTYNNVEYITNEVMISYHTFSANTIMFFRKLSSGNLQIDNIAQSSYLGELNYIPALGSSFQWYYNTVNRLWYSHEAGESSWIQTDYINLATNKSDETSNIEALQVVSYQDFGKVLSNTLCIKSPDVKNHGFAIYGELSSYDNVLSNFSTSNYAIIHAKFEPENYSWEMNFIIGTSANVTTTQEICSDSTNSLEIEITNGHFALEVNSGSSVQGTYNVLPSTVYYIKVQFTGTQYILSYSLDGLSYIQDVVVTNSESYRGANLLYIGKDVNNNSEPWLGTMNITGFNIIVNNILIWQGNPPITNIYPTSKSPAAVVESYINSASGYRVWSDGYCEQWGNVTISGFTISLLKSYVDTNYNIVLGAYTSGGLSGNQSGGWKDKTRSSFYLQYGSCNGFDWKTCGYIK